MNLRKFFFNNIGIKLVAFFLALFVWILIVGKDRAYSEKSFEINVDYINLHENLEIKNIEKIRVEVRGTRRVIDQLTQSSFKLEVDLKNISKASRIQRWVQDYLQAPEELEILSIRPRSLEIVTDEFLTKTIPVRIKFKGKLNKDLKLISQVIEPENVVIKGYKDKISKINSISPNEIIDRSKITQSTTFQIPLERGENILRIEGNHQVNVTINVEKKDGKKTKKQNTGR